MTSRVDQEAAAIILRKLPAAEAFFFYTGIGQYTNQLATDLGDFAEKLKNVPLGSIEFHIKDGDFSKWTKETLKDDYLAEKIEEISPLLEGEKLRAFLCKVAEKRVKQLESARNKTPMREES